MTCTGAYTFLVSACDGTCHGERCVTHEESRCDSQCNLFSGSITEFGKMSLEQRGLHGSDQF